MRGGERRATVRKFVCMHEAKVNINTAAAYTHQQQQQSFNLLIFDKLIKHVACSIGTQATRQNAKASRTAGGSVPGRT